MAGLKIDAENSEKKKEGMWEQLREGRRDGRREMEGDGERQEYIKKNRGCKESDRKKVKKGG